MARFFVDGLRAEGRLYTLTGENAGYPKVLRLTSTP